MGRGNVCAVLCVLAPVVSEALPWAMVTAGSRRHASGTHLINLP